MNDFNFYKHIKVNDRFYIVQEDYGFQVLNIYVLIGDFKVAVIDSGMGTVGGLRKYIETFITDKRPMVSYATHGHIDHIGGAILFDAAYLNHGDYNGIEWALNVERRFGDLEWFSDNNQEMLNYSRIHYLKNKDTQFKDINDGDQIDLGGIELSVIALPGHSKGSVAYYWADGKCAFMGDAVGGNSVPDTQKTTNAVGGSCKGGKTEFLEAIKALKRFSALVPPDTLLYGGHCISGQTSPVIPYEVIPDRIRGLQEIIDNKTEHDIPFTLVQKIQAPENYKMKRKKHQCGIATITYDSNLIGSEGI